MSVFGDDGFTAQEGSTNNNYINENNVNIVAWNWKAGGGTTTSVSESGDNPANTRQTNATAGFSIITYTGTGAAGTIAHGLGAVPKWIITKTRSHTGDWMVYHGMNTTAPETDFLKLNETNATEDLNTVYNDTAPTSSVFTLGSNGDVNTDGRTQVAYVFAEVEGFSKFGFYSGNGNADGAFVFCGFRPAFCIVKRTDSTNQWNIWDDKRSSASGNNVLDYFQIANDTDAENTSGGNNIDFVSNGFKVRNNGNASNNSSGTYVFMAFAEAPFKYANAK